MKGEIIMTDSTITQTMMSMTTTTPILKINEVEYKIKIGDNDIRYKFAPISQFVKDSMKNKKGKWLVKEMEFATHVLITDVVDRFTNQHTTISMYLTPKQ
jgi:translation initiation factor IF-3